MGFFKRFFSFGSKKDKKRASIPDALVAAPKTPSTDNERKRKLEEEEHEAAVGRLLRSSSSRYAVVKEIDYSNLPPLPHPINDVLAGCNNTPRPQTPSLRPSPSTASLASSNFSRTSTFSVTVHDRQRHAVTEFPNANGEFGEDMKTPTQPSKRHSNALALRSDPSVASLIEMYDEHGRLPAEAFSNNSPSPEKLGRPQKKRGGSTLRELLGGSDTLGSGGDSNIESDISWAEKYLGEDESSSSHSSFGPHTPSTCTDSTHDRTEIPKAHGFPFSTDLSTSVPDDGAFTSMEVELSDAASAKDNNPYMNTDPITPQRASQVFSFITKRNSVHHERVPSRIPFSTSPYDGPRSRFSTDESLHDTRASRHSRNSFGPFQENNQTPRQRVLKTHAIPVSPVAEDDDDHAEPPKHKVRVLMSGPTKIMVTAPTPGTQQEQTASRIPIRGSHQNPNKRKAPSTTRRTPMLTQQMNVSTNSSSSSRASTKRLRESSTAVPRGAGRTTRRIASRASTASTTSSRAEADALAMATACALDQLARSRTYPHTSSPTRTPRGGSGDKENQQLSAQVDLPSTPLRSHTTGGKTPLSRKAITPGLFQPPTPSGGVLRESRRQSGGGNSSSELSPVGKQMMLDARQQRMRVREWDRERRSARKSVGGTPGRSQPAGVRAIGSPF
ncbi:hypothetical protein NP233_g6355 [Leucocoprinus birnbaumii]|uniref:Uncharacterized protein n=1 Tax=Leucocoprinus birnbaumii TaxID=56174 RepID=A0AAD5YTR1_9AGAR|nr:hypothetical protein NP233_g6355 [Leucocoprinus birnbaumii]